MRLIARLWIVGHCESQRAWHARREYADTEVWPTGEYQIRGCQSSEITEMLGSGRLLVTYTAELTNHSQGRSSRGQTAAVE
jgi:hypothetical protein